MTALLWCFLHRLHYLNLFVLLLSDLVATCTLFRYLTPSHPASQELAIATPAQKHSILARDIRHGTGPSNAHNNLMPIADRSILRPNY